MPPLPPKAVDVTRLVAELASPDPLRRQTAVARLALTGTRAVTRLLPLAASTDPAARLARAAALDALASIGDPRALPIALVASADADDAVGLAAIDVLGPMVRGEGPAAAAALDRLAALALDPALPADRRAAAVNALQGLPDDLLHPLREAMRHTSPTAAVPTADRAELGATLDDMSAQTALVLLREAAPRTPINTLHAMVEHLRARERAAAPADAASWTAVRGIVHQALGARESRVALYDLRETLEAAQGPLPVGFLAAAAAVGDETCLVPLAAAWCGADPENRWWRDHLAEAFGAITRREGITRRHRILRKILTDRPQAGPLVALARR